jgi:hypothetical protein
MLLCEDLARAFSSKARRWRHQSRRLTLNTCTFSRIHITTIALEAPRRVNDVV